MTNGPSFAQATGQPTVGSGTLPGTQLSFLDILRGSGVIPGLTQLATTGRPSGTAGIGGILGAGIGNLIAPGVGGGIGGVVGGIAGSALGGVFGGGGSQRNINLPGITQLATEFPEFGPSQIAAFSPAQLQSFRGAHQGGQNTLVIEVEDVVRKQFNLAKEFFPQAFEGQTFEEVATGFTNLGGDSPEANRTNQASRLQELFAIRQAIEGVAVSANRPDALFALRLLPQDKRRDIEARFSSSVIAGQARTAREAGIQSFDVAGGIEQLNREREEEAQRTGSNIPIPLTAGQLASKLGFDPIDPRTGRPLVRFIGERVMTPEEFIDIVAKQGNPQALNLVAKAERGGDTTNLSHFREGATLPFQLKALGTQRSQIQDVIAEFRDSVAQATSEGTVADIPGIISKVQSANPEFANVEGNLNQLFTKLQSDVSPLFAATQQQTTLGQPSELSFSNPLAAPTAQVSQGPTPAQPATATTPAPESAAERITLESKFAQEARQRRRLRRSPGVSGTVITGPLGLSTGGKVLLGA